VIVVDTSAWVEWLRATGSRADRGLTQLLDEGEELAVTEIVVMELLAGAQQGEVARVRGLLEELPTLPLQGVSDFESAATLYRACRVAGETVRELTDCLVAVPAIRAEASVLHADLDFERLARHTPLEVVRLRE
jgi:predicted nucleic acid-binding protein